MEILSEYGNLVKYPPIPDWYYPYPSQCRGGGFLSHSMGRDDLLAHYPRPMKHCAVDRRDDGRMKVCAGIVVPGNRPMSNTRFSGQEWQTVAAHAGLHIAIQPSPDVLLGQNAARGPNRSPNFISLFPFLVNVNPSCATPYQHAAEKMRTQQSGLSRSITCRAEFIIQS